MAILDKVLAELARLWLIDIQFLSSCMDDEWWWVLVALLYSWWMVAKWVALTTPIWVPAVIIIRSIRGK